MYHRTSPECSFQITLLGTHEALSVNILTMLLGTYEALGIGIQTITRLALDVELDYFAWNARSLGRRFRLCRLEHMKPWTQVVRFMTRTVNPRGECLGE